MALSKEAKTSLIAGILTLGVALIVFLAILLVRYFSKKKAEGKEEVKEGEKDKEESEKKEQNKEKDKKKENDKTKDKKTDDKNISSSKTSITTSTEVTKSELPKTITRKINGQDVVAKLGEDGKYHVKASQIITRKGLQDGLTSVKNSTNSSINTTVQQQEEFNRKISELGKELDATKAKLAEQQQQKLQVDQLSAAIGAAAPSVIDAVFAKLNDFEFIPPLNATPLTTMDTINKAAKKENDLPDAPPVVNTKEDVTKNIEPKVIKQEVKTSLEAANKAKEAEKGNAL